MVMASMLIAMVLVYGDHPVSHNADWFIGKKISETSPVLHSTYYIERCVQATFDTCRGMPIHCDINGNRRAGMTIYVNEKFLIVRLFAPR